VISKFTGGGDMLQAVLVWVGAVLAIGLLLVMALGPVIVEVDSWFYERKARKAAARKAQQAAKARTQTPAVTRVPHPVA
jgi:hypothetical protein